MSAIGGPFSKKRGYGDGIFIQYPIFIMLGFFIFPVLFRPLCFSALFCMNHPKTRVVTRNFCLLTKYNQCHFFVECAESRVLTFASVVEKKYARSREILTFRFAVGSKT
jgi:hypothetical protein